MPWSLAGPLNPPRVRAARSPYSMIVGEAYGFRLGASLSFLEFALLA